jgi:predicted regulator of Ras-like GTPase activity (Roadblock/LC7/MglB family)
MAGESREEQGGEGAMSFEAILQSIVDECGGGWSAALMGMDGIAVAQVGAAQGPDPADPLSGDVTRAGVEFGRTLADMTKASESMGTGDLRESVISVDRLTLVFHAVDEDLILVLALSPDGNLGKARYLIRRSLLKLRALL